MESIFSVENFESGGSCHEINSPRSLEACLRIGLDPSELMPKPKSSFHSKNMTKELVEIKYEHFESKRKEKIALVKNERTLIVNFAGKGRHIGGSSPSKTATMSQNEEAESNLVLLEQKRMEALRRRQEKELQKIIEREQAMAELQKKIKRTEDEEIKKKKAHEKKVLEQKKEEEKKANQRAHELKRLEEEELQRRRDLARKEAEFEIKMNKQRKEEEKKMEMEAMQREMERREKMEEAAKKTEMLIQVQFDKAEENRRIMMEREARVKKQLDDKKEQKQNEVQEQRDKAAKRILEALEKHHELQVLKKTQFDERQQQAAVRAKERRTIELEELKKQADERDKKEKARIHRLIEAYRHRNEHREEIIHRREEKDELSHRVIEEQTKRLEMMKFQSDMKISDKTENVERVLRKFEFDRLQTLKRIEDEDLRYERITNSKSDMLRRHREEMKHSLIRKHEIGDAMERMRMTNDYSLLDKLFAKKGKKEKRGKHDNEEDDRAMTA